MTHRSYGGIALRIALAAIGSVAVGVAIVALGVTVMGGDAFTQLMTLHGTSAESAHRMFDDSVTRVVILAVVVGVAAATLLAILFARRLGRPLGEVSRAARRIAQGDYRARVPREGPEELASLAD